MFLVLYNDAPGIITLATWKWTGALRNKAIVKRPPKWPHCVLFSNSTRHRIWVMFARTFFKHIGFVITGLNFCKLALLKSTIDLHMMFTLSPFLSTSTTYCFFISINFKCYAVSKQFIYHYWKGWEGNMCVVWILMRLFDTSFGFNI